MKIAVHQPNFIPWIGYFQKIAAADLFVLYDTVEYTKNSYLNRNKIKTPQGSQWLTIPVKYSGNSTQAIKDIKMAINEKGLTKILKTIRANYAKSKEFSRYFPDLESLFYSESHQYYLANFNIELITWLCKCLCIKTQIVKASELDLELTQDPTLKLISICKNFEASHYISGKGGFNYQDLSKFSSASIKVMPIQYNSLGYNQLWGDFIPNLSVIDFLFNSDMGEIRNFE